MGFRLLGSAGGDHTATMRHWADTVMGELCKKDLSGFVLDKRSPSCGLERVRVWDEGAQRPSRPGRGVFAQALVDATPGLAIGEEGRAGARRHQRGARPSERPTTAGAAPAAQALSARLSLEGRGAASSALRTAAPSEVSRRSRAEVRLPPPTTRVARPPMHTSSDLGRASLSDVAQTDHASIRGSGARSADRLAFPAERDPAEFVQPGERSFHHPAHAAESQPWSVQRRAITGFTPRDSSRRYLSWS